MYIIDIIYTFLYIGDSKGDDRDDRGVSNECDRGKKKME